VPVLGNLRDLDPEKGILGLMDLAREYGPIYRLQMPGADVVVVGSQELVDELCDESRFDKMLHRPLRQVRDFAGDGLFTAETAEENWGAAHRILMPAFGPAALAGCSTAWPTSPTRRRSSGNGRGPASVSTSPTTPPG
jgi:cytochrome P450/NADPH-cytochrome P450 reductase